MNYRTLHPWGVSPSEAIVIQKDLHSRLILDEAPQAIQTVAGIDVSFTRGQRRLFASIVVIDLTRPYRESNRPFSIIETAVGSLEVDLPYIPGLLSFREIPVVLSAWKKLEHRPDCLVCDGQGLAHPRRMGLAAHLGLIVDRPSIGCGKTRLIGEYQAPGPNKGDRSSLVDREEIVGTVLRTRKRVKPIFISQGHRMTLEAAIKIILSCQVRHRLPEPIRMAHRLANEARRKNLSSDERDSRLYD